MSLYVKCCIQFDRISKFIGYKLSEHLLVVMCLSFYVVIKLCFLFNAKFRRLKRLLLPSVMMLVTFTCHPSHDPFPFWVSGWPRLRLIYRWPSFTG